MARLFIGIDFPPAEKQRLGLLQQRLQTLGVRAHWTPKRLLHMTVLFLGETPETNVGGIQRTAAEVLADERPSVLAVDRVGLFRRNRILWVGVPSACENRFARIQRRLAKRLRRELGMVIEDRPYQAHITLARQLQFPVPRLESHVMDGLRFEFLTNSLVLFESTRQHGQLEYVVRARLPMQTPPGNGQPGAEPGW
ncbi:MAG: RNA 2',3'-cyclic phosphodiesterase [Alicyclobacillus herbarius]|uniref:RNA 2',3'-cyclic phosphodiesterase n=1 Tax=Alicyclobacillus herbarius TaxID=122960 RepID=UPI0003F5FE82|nr:RNA 2',3'-cyclic phosphodiesterase [Alicyclobacillus herbarius]MCL6631561.1 RNA 2',3'-cyclic phosphodiesterase [Alicyclobacillus herbarius]